jgi:hypothetical protein
MMSDGDVVFSNVGVSSRHHTLLMENLPSWNKFPKRSKFIEAAARKRQTTSPNGIESRYGDRLNTQIPAET